MVVIRNVATGQLSDVITGQVTAFSPEGGRILTVPRDDPGPLRIHNVNTGAVLAESDSDGPLFAGPPPGPKAVFTPDGRQVVAIRVDAGQQYVDVFDALTLAPLGGAPVPIGNVGRAIGVTPDGGQAIVVVSSTEEPYNTEVVLIDLATRRVVRSTPVELLGEPFQGSRNNSFAADGRTVGLGNNNGDLGVVDAVTGEVATRPHVHNGVESVAFAPDVATFITTGQDGAAYLWDSETQQELGSMAPLGANRVRARFLADDWVMFVYGTGDILEWDPRPDAWEAHACKVAGRNFTRAEWDELFAGEAYRLTCPQYPAGE
jgi:WD40 repeat protein